MLAKLAIRARASIFATCAVAVGSEFVLTGDEHGAGKVRCVIEESKTAAGGSGVEGG